MKVNKLLMEAKERSITKEEALFLFNSTHEMPQILNLFDVASMFCFCL